MTLKIGSTRCRYSLAHSKKALAGLPGGDLGKAEAACPAAPLSPAVSRVFSYMPVSACLLVTPEESFATAHCIPLMPLLTAPATTSRPCPFLVFAVACPWIYAC